MVMTGFPHAEDRFTTSNMKKETGTMLLDYQTADQWLTGRNRNSKKLKNNTYLERKADGDIAVRLHSTDIITLHRNCSATLDSGGWRTMTTKDRLNEYGFIISQQEGIWMYHGIQRWPYKQSAPVLFKDGMRVGTNNGEVVAGHPETDEMDSIKKLRERIKKYARLCSDSLPIPHPGPGDCFFCSLVDKDSGKPWGDDKTDHLLSHMEEGYVVPSLVYNALKEDGELNSMTMQGAFGGENKLLDLAQEHVRRAVRKYMYRRFGIAT